MGGCKGRPGLRAGQPWRYEAGVRLPHGCWGAMGSAGGHGPLPPSALGRAVLLRLPSARVPTLQSRAAARTSGFEVAVGISTESEVLNEGVTSGGGCRGL